MKDPRSDHRYTAYFCEENVWWLAHQWQQQAADREPAWVCLFTNADASIAVMNQRAAAPGALMAWDYHVVFAAEVAGAPKVFDLDSRLPFPSPWRVYFDGTFPNPSGLPERWRSEVRQIPARGYLDRFYSDRQHMVGKVPPSAFPDYPPLGPKNSGMAIHLSQYRDLGKWLDDGSLVAPVEEARNGPLS